MNILHIQKVRSIAGSETHLLALLPRLRAYGYQSSVLILADKDDRPETFAERLRAEDIPVHVIRLRIDFDPIALWQTVRWVRHQKFDLVHTHLIHAGLYGRLAGRAAGVGIVSSYHNLNTQYAHPVFRRLEQWTASMCSAVICISDAVRAHLQSLIRLEEERVHVVHYGIPVFPLSDQRTPASQAADTNTTMTIGIVGRLIDGKGHDDLLYALAQVVKTTPNVKLQIVGDGPLRTPLAALVTQLGLDPYVDFLGYRSDAATLMHQFDLFVLPSLSEGFGLVVLEAMAASKPVITTNVSALPEIVVANETGVLVPPRDPNALAQAIHTLLSRPDLRAAMGACGRERLEQQFTVERMVEHTARIYAAVKPT